MLDAADKTHPPAPFVVGAGRSGTTLLRMMLDAHPELTIPPETRFVPRLIRVCRGADATPADASRLLAAERNWADFGIDAADVEHRLAAAPAVTPATGVRAFYEAYAERIGKPRWGDKTPAYGARMPMIGRALPEARFVHLVRDGRDVALSWRRFRESRRDDPLTLAHWAGVWRETVGEIRAKSKRVDHYLELRYEDLVSEPRQSLERVCELVALPFDAAMLDYHATAAERLAELASGLPPKGEQQARSADDRIAPHELVTKPPQADRIGAWREALEPAERSEVEAAAGELLTELYPD
jgi:hypothetical protein